MKKWMSIFVMTIVIGSVAHGFSDDFEDGVIDPSLWVTGGRRTGGWSFSHREVPAPDGYLEANVKGPTSGVTYGAEAWFRTVYNFNDGRPWLIDFTWQANRSAYHVDRFFIQIGDAYFPSDPGITDHWIDTDEPGRATLFGVYMSGAVQFYMKDGILVESGALEPKPYDDPVFSEPTEWSILIDSSTDTATLYQGPGATGNVYASRPLDLTKPCYGRFFLSDFTSAGYPGGDNSLYLYDFSAAVAASYPVSEPVTGTATQAGSGLDETDPAKMVQIRIGDVEIKFVPLVSGGTVTITKLKCNSIEGDSTTILTNIGGIRATTSFANGDFVALLKFYYEESDLPAGWTERDLAVHRLMVSNWVPRWVAELMIDMAPYPTYGSPTLDIGDWGVDTDGNYVWANINTFTDYAVGLVSEPSSIEAAIDIDPDTLNLKSKGKWIPCYIELTGSYDVGDIDISTIMLNEQVPAESSPADIGDYDDDGVPDLMVKFDRSAIQEILEVANEVEIKVTGDLTDGTPFEGTDTIRVIEKGGKK